jgi:putative redox protein
MSEPVHESANRDAVVTSLQNFSSVAIIGGEHSVVIDEPREFLGDGVGPNPFGLILSALGGCIAGTLRGVARREGFDYEKATRSRSRSTVLPAARWTPESESSGSPKSLPR